MTSIAVWRDPRGGIDVALGHGPVERFALSTASALAVQLHRACRLSSLLTRKEMRERHELDETVPGITIAVDATKRDGGFIELSINGTTGHFQAGTCAAAATSIQRIVTSQLTKGSTR